MIKRPPRIISSLSSTNSFSSPRLDIKKKLAFCLSENSLSTATIRPNKKITIKEYIESYREHDTKSPIKTNIKTKENQSKKMTVREYIETFKFHEIKSPIKGKHIKNQKHLFTPKDKTTLKTTVKETPTIKSFKRPVYKTELNSSVKQNKKSVNTSIKKTKSPKQVTKKENKKKEENKPFLFLCVLCYKEEGNPYGYLKYEPEERYHPSVALYRRNKDINGADNMDRKVYCSKCKNLTKYFYEYQNK